MNLFKKLLQRKSANQPAKSEDKASNGPINMKHDEENKKIMKNNNNTSTKTNPIAININAKHLEKRVFPSCSSTSSNTASTSFEYTDNDNQQKADDIFPKPLEELLLFDKTFLDEWDVVSLADIEAVKNNEHEKNIKKKSKSLINIFEEIILQKSVIDVEEVAKRLNTYEPYIDSVMLQEKFGLDDKGGILISFDHIIVHKSTEEVQLEVNVTPKPKTAEEILEDYEFREKWYKFFETLIDWMIKIGKYLNLQ